VPYLRYVTVHGRKVICHSSLKKWVDSWQSGALLPTHKVLRQQAAAQAKPKHGQPMRNTASAQGSTRPFVAMANTRQESKSDARPTKKQNLLRR